MFNLMDFFYLYFSKGLDPYKKAEASGITGMATKAMYLSVTSQSLFSGTATTKNVRVRSFTVRCSTGAASTGAVATGTLSFYNFIIYISAYLY